MEYRVCDDTTNEDKQRRIRSWLYRLLSAIEEGAIEEAKQTESGHTVTIEVTFRGGRQ